MKARCNLCSHRCLIKKDRLGICGVRLNKNGQLLSLVYARAIAVNTDPIEKKPLYHFLPGTKTFSIATAGCNFRCRFCQNADISQIGQAVQAAGSKRAFIEKISLNLPPEKVVEQALKNGCRSVAYTYTEPTIFFEYAADTARLAKKKGLKNVFVTNGYQTPATIAMMDGLIDAANVDLKSFSDKFYRQICGARLQPVLDAIGSMYKAGIRLELTTLIIPQLNDSEEELAQIAAFIAKLDKNIPWHISRFRGAYKMAHHPETPLKTLYKAARIGELAGLNYVYLGNVPGNKRENTYCPRCGAVAIKRVGFKTGPTQVTQEGKCKSCGFYLGVVV